MLLLIVILMIAAIAVWAFAKGGGGPPSSQPPPSSQNIKLGNYGALVDFSNEAKTQAEVKTMIEKYNVLDFQFFDWAQNYAGIFQNFDHGNWTNPSPAPGWWKPTPYWWRNGSWTDTYLGSVKVDAGAIKTAIKQIHDAGGRSWAYVQAQTTEYLNLTGDWRGCNETPLQGNQCGKPKSNDPQTIIVGGDSSPKVKALFPFFGQAEEAQSLCKWYGKDGNNNTIWGCQSGFHTLPAYKLNGALARYQCNAWIPILLELGFSGIHWDLFKLGGVDPDEAAGAAEFMKVAGELLSKYGLYQTFNNVLAAYNWDLFTFGLKGSLLFPYAEVWTSSVYDTYASTVAMVHPGAVAAWYTGGKPYIEDKSCCATTAQGYPSGTTKDTQFIQCEYPPNTPLGADYICATDQNQCQYGVNAENAGVPFQCPPAMNGENRPMTQAELSAYFWETCCRNNVRLLILVDGEHQIRQDYFRDYVSLSPELKTAILANPQCGQAYLKA